MFQTKKDFITCSKLIINDLGRIVNFRLDQILSILLSMTKHLSQSLLLRLVLPMLNIT